MTRQTMLSGVALAALILATAPVQAQVLNLGGGNDGGSSVSVDLGGDGGGGLLNLGGDDGNDVDGDVSINDNTIIDVDGDGDGDLIDLDGDSVGDQEIEVDLFGPGDGGETQLALGTDGDGDDDALVTLFGSGGEADAASVDILPGGSGDVGGIGGGGTDTDADVNLDLFGDGGDDGTDPTETGSTDDGDDGTGGSGSDGGGVQPMPDTLVAAAGDAGIATDCFAPNEQQIAHLLARGTYDDAVVAQWSAASDVNLIAVNLCPEAQAQLAAVLSGDANLDYMQSAVAMNATIVAELAPSYTANDVLAVDQSGNELTVYVY